MGLHEIIINIKKFKNCCYELRKSNFNMLPFYFRLMNHYPKVWTPYIAYFFAKFFYYSSNLYQKMNVFFYVWEVKFQNLTIYWQKNSFLSWISLVEIVITQPHSFSSHGLGSTSLYSHIQFSISLHWLETLLTYPTTFPFSTSLLIKKLSCRLNT